jgi:hypothetical protein
MPSHRESSNTQPESLIPGLPDDPTAAECIALLAQSYRPEGVAVVLRSRISTLGGVTPESLMDTADGRRQVYMWALGLAEGVMG